MIVSMVIGVFVHVPIAAMILGKVCRDVCQERRERRLEFLLCAPVEERSILRAKFKGMMLSYGMAYLVSTFFTVLLLILFFVGSEKIVSLFSKGGFSLSYAPFLGWFFFLMLLAGCSIKLAKSSPQTFFRKPLCWSILAVGGLTLLLIFYYHFSFSSSETLGMTICALESVEDVTFLGAIFAVAFHSGLFSKTATNAILKAFGWTAGFLILWGLSVGIGMETAHEQEMVLLTAIIFKIGVEIAVFFFLMQRLALHLREWVCMPVESG